MLHTNIQSKTGNKCQSNVITTLHSRHHLFHLLDQLDKAGCSPLPDENLEAGIVVTN